jgi:hypothetical protein
MAAILRTNLPQRNRFRFENDHRANASACHLPYKKDKLMLTRHRDFITLSAGNFRDVPPEGTQRELKEVKKLPLTI